MMTPVSRGISGHKASLVSHRAQHDYISFSVFSPIIVLNYRIACDTLIELSIFFWFHDHYQLQVLLYVRVYFIWEKNKTTLQRAIWLWGLNRVSKRLSIIIYKLRLITLFFSVSKLYFTSLTVCFSMFSCGHSLIRSLFSWFLFVYSQNSR